MAFISLDDTALQIKKPVTRKIMKIIKDDLDALNALISGGTGSTVIANGSFDIDSDANNLPDNWNTNVYSGGTVILDATNAAHGANALKMVHPSGSGNGGGYVDSDYIPCNELQGFKVGFLHKCSQSGVKNQITIRYYSEAKVYVSDETIYSETTNPTDWDHIFSDLASPPATAQYMVIRVIGGYTDTDPGSSTNIWFDGMYLITDVWVKDRADTSVYLDNNVVFQDLDIEKDIMLQFVAVGDNNGATTIQFSDDNGATFETVEGTTTLNGSMTNQSDNTVPLTDVNFEWADGGHINLIRLPDGGTRINGNILLSADGGLTITGSMVISVVCATPVNCFKIYAAGNFDAVAASVSIHERNL